MNPIFSRTLKALCTVAVAVLLSACGGASSTVEPFKPTRIIAFGDGFSYVDANGYGLSTVQTNEVDNTIAGRIAARVNFPVKSVAANPLAATGGFSYATANARVADVNNQITAFLASAGGVVAKQDLILVTVGNWDIYDAVTSNANLDTATSNLVAGIARLVAAGAEHVVVMPAINMARTPWALTAPNGKSLEDIQKLSITTSTLPSLTSFNFLLLQKLNAAYPQDKKPVYVLDRAGDFNSFAGKFDTNGTTRIINASGLALTSDTGFYQPVCPTPTVLEGCTVASLNGSTNYQSYVFADNINLTPLANRFLADRMVFLLLNYGWLP
jgi:outer membrane lipase/esterase